MNYKADIYLVLPEEDYTYQWLKLKPRIQFLYENQLNKTTVLFNWKDVDIYSDYGSSILAAIEQYKATHDDYEYMFLGEDIDDIKHYLGENTIGILEVERAVKICIYN